ncbi:ammonium transporter [Methylomonas sp. MED-D]|uniref:Ammonium transporter n=1 Tax=Methylomonas koyamae TaxID=702114 RepID=A0A177PCC7_9GAMM|nr:MULTISPECIES: ammonium transporter [Methylomonas]NJA05535.1 ammonium transporter [Methylococcaceae bacterium WWC4]MDT4331281.1 ammonium transporter [Methylomonas sp. MV1]OAI28017.1 ammonia channel protein [Methylomonas koyamae]OHX36556.1 ammonia channel protein [Methylomonas sp. LWB]WGS84581.1 ammonium transporter [Methylomonas sp. UP202]
MRYVAGMALLALLGFSGIAGAEEAAAPAVQATVNKGDTAWMIVATVLVALMVIPGLALFYGGMVRAKNMLSILMQVFVIFSLSAILWAVYGYSVAFTEGNAFFGGFSKAFLSGITPDSMAATFSKGVYVPEYIYVAFQLTFSAITPALIIGAFAERVKFSAVLLFTVIWFSICYLPMAHMVWYWAGPDAYTDATAAEAAGATAGFLFQKGALDFAGGTVVHINAGMAGLVGCLLIGKRIGYGKEFIAPHSVTMNMIGASLLWIGWFGFNAGSNLEANGLAALVFVNTLLAAAAATLSWMVMEWLVRGKPSMLGATSGAVAGLVAITPACGWAGPMGSIALGFVVGAVCFWSVTRLKHALNYDDSLDAFGVHGVGGIVGALGTGIVASPALGGTGVWDYVANAVAEYDMLTQVTSQAWGVGVAIVWSGIASFVAFKIADVAVGLRVNEATEREGLDVTEHGETAYHI